MPHVWGRGPHCEAADHAAMCHPSWHWNTAPRSCGKHRTCCMLCRVWSCLPPFTTLDYSTLHPSYPKCYFVVRKRQPRGLRSPGLPLTLSLRLLLPLTKRPTVALHGVFIVPSGPRSPLHIVIGTLFRRCGVTLYPLVRGACPRCCSTRTAAVWVPRTGCASPGPCTRSASTTTPLWWVGGRVSQCREEHGNALSGRAMCIAAVALAGVGAQEPSRRLRYKSCGPCGRMSRRAWCPPAAPAAAL